MDRSWRHVLTFFVFLALLAAGCSSDPDDLVVGEDVVVDGEDVVVDDDDESPVGARTLSDVDSALEDEEDSAVAAESSPEEIAARQAEMLDAVELAQATWERNGILDYDFTMIATTSGEVDDGPIAPAYEVEVREGEVVRTLPEDEFSPELHDFTIASLLEELPEAILEEDDFNVTFDDAGVPVEFGGPIDDGAVSISIVNFRTPDDYPDECSTSGLGVDLIDVEASAAVNATRNEVLEALANCDFVALSRLAHLGAEPLITDFGGSGVEQLWEAEANDDPLMTTLFELITGPASTDSDGITSWPVEFSDPDSDYVGWRAGISDAGEWLFFIAGD